ncbi:hypothetical protein BJY01DRAFT_219964 [Aspergillus pseudoustus]|uniref:Uncharacterized protein n=1 Tax=Aspergillus pseudoustus TaxID=1810923 RepID=A0ABR4JHL8_9EURO
MAACFESDTERAMDRPGRAFLDNLLPPIFQHYPYRGRSQFQNDFEAASEASQGTFNEWFIVTGVNKDIFESVFSEAQESPFCRWTAYDPQVEKLLVRIMAGVPHETASRVFDHMVLQAADATGVTLQPLGSGRHSGSMGNKEADEAWRPERLPVGRNRHWPSGVLEVGYSESYPKLQADLRFWAQASPCTSHNDETECLWRQD